jgi:hypothetical protein
MSDQSSSASLTRRFNQGLGRHDTEDKDRHALASRDQTIKLIRRPTKGPIQKPADYKSLICGLTAGVAQAGIFNPYDRALYLAIKESRPFLSKANWTKPYTGFFQSLGARAIGEFASVCILLSCVLMMAEKGLNDLSHPFVAHLHITFAAGGLYFPCEHFFLHLLNASESHPVSNFIAGTLSGGSLALIMNPLTTIRYKTWGRSTNQGVFHEAHHMLVQSGYSLRPFLNGLNATVCRDAAFGACYTTIRLQLQWVYDLEAHNQFKGNFVAAGLATVVSSPWNYCRTIQYATRSKERQPTIRQVFAELAKEVKHEKGALAQLRLLQNRLRIGWGTLRVALGLSFAHSVYDGLQETLNNNTRL